MRILNGVKKATKAAYPKPKNGEQRSPLTESYTMGSRVGKPTGDLSI